MAWLVRNTDDIQKFFTSENGFKAEQSDEPVKEQKEALLQNEVTKQAEDGTAQATVKHQQVEGTTEETEQQSTDNHATTDAELGKDEKFEADDGQEPDKVENFEADGSQELPTNEESKQPSDEVPQQEVDDGSTITCRIEVPNAKVGVLIGKAGDAISIIKGEKLVNAVIVEADAGGSPSLVARGLATTQAAGDADHIEIQVPNEKVGLIIGKGGETIRGVQTRSGAHIQAKNERGGDIVDDLFVQQRYGCTHVRCMPFLVRLLGEEKNIFIHLFVTDMFGVKLYIDGLTDMFGGFSNWMCQVLEKADSKQEIFPSLCSPTLLFLFRMLLI
ncbi:Far upstream element-binding 1 [Gossypium arboreum]|uniref:Far upstream element-binding 1 n=1 Tax=Gossypium arboreum TaxID=29729 RepID=A0A0B0NES0_GOSAR|nr:Far upstream element-binding 1 [Gossypium arboreum]